MRILVDEMPAYKDECIFSDMFWDEDTWKTCCTLDRDGCSKCDLENGECSYLCAFRLKLMTTTPYVYKPAAPTIYWTQSSHMPDACLTCSNHPSNGGTGICHCTLGSQSVTCNSIDCPGR